MPVSQNHNNESHVDKFSNQTKLQHNSTLTNYYNETKIISQSRVNWQT